MARGVSAISTQVPSAGTPMLDAAGNVTQAWYRFFSTLQFRTGQQAGVDASLLQEQANTGPTTASSFDEIADPISILDPDFSNVFMTNDTDPLALRDVTQAPGTTTNDAAMVGNLGETLSVTVPVGSPVALTTNVTTDIGSFAITPGNWIVWGGLAWVVAAGTTVSAVIGWTTNLSATNPGAPNGGGMGQWLGSVVGNAPVLPVGIHRLNFAAAGTIYLTAAATFTGSTLSAYGFAGAMRVR